jgi:hypothetical protein
MMARIRRMSMRLAKVLVVLNLFSIILGGAEPDPFIGKWMLNWAKSLSTHLRPRMVVRSYQQSGKGVRVQEKWVDANGKKTSLDYVASYDGHDYPVRSVKGETVAFTRTDTYTVQGVSKKDDKVEYTFRRLVSPDGKTLTVEMTTTDSAGKPATELLVYDKMK